MDTFPTAGRRAVYVIHEGGDTPTYVLCDPCIDATIDPVAARADIVGRDDAAHCVGCDYHADPDCGPGHWCRGSEHVNADELEEVDTPHWDADRQQWINADGTPELEEERIARARPVLNRHTDLPADATSCPACGSEDLQLWAEDGESSDADFWECGSCDVGGDVVRPSRVLERIEWIGEPVVGQLVKGRLIGSDGRSSWNVFFSGLYHGIRPDEDDGAPFHFFTRGVVGTTPQAAFGFPVRELAD